MSNMHALWRLLESAKLYDLGQPLETNIPVSPLLTPFRMALVRRHGDSVRPGGVSAASEMFVTSAHTGTHFDALCHISHDGKLYGGVDASQAMEGGRFKELSVDTVPPIVCRGILLDVAGLYGVPTLPPAKGITADDLQRAAEREGVEPRRGDCVLVRSGWSVHWPDPVAYVGQKTGVPGVDMSGAELIAQWGARITGHDSVIYEQSFPDANRNVLAVHRLLMQQNGIHIMELLNLEELARNRVYEFLFMVSPLKIVGATGSPVRPVAMVV